MYRQAQAMDLAAGRNIEPVRGTEWVGSEAERRISAAE